MDKLDQILNEFIEAWNAGERPRVDDYVGRAPATERDELAGLIGAFLEVAPAPDYSPEQLAQLREDPAVKQIAAVIDSRSGLWPTLLPRLRIRAKLTRDQVVARLAELLALEGREAKIKRYYHRMESGTIAPGGVSVKVLEALGRILGADVHEIEEAGNFGIAVPASEGLYLRAPEAHGLETLARMERVESAGTARPDPAKEMDEVDRLFLGGR